MDTVLTAIKTGPSKMELREFPMPEVPTDGALLKMEVAGICGTDVKMYKQPLTNKLALRALRSGRRTRNIGPRTFDSGH